MWKNQFRLVISDDEGILIEIFMITFIFSFFNVIPNPIYRDLVRRAGWHHVNDGHFSNINTIEGFSFSEIVCLSVLFVEKNRALQRTSEKLFFKYPIYPLKNTCTPFFLWGIHSHFHFSTKKIMTIWHILQGIVKIVKLVKTVFVGIRKIRTSVWSVQNDGFCKYVFWRVCISKKINEYYYRSHLKFNFLSRLMYQSEMK